MRFQLFLFILVCPFLMKAQHGFEITSNAPHATTVVDAAGKVIAITKSDISRENPGVDWWFKCLERIPAHTIAQDRKSVV